MTRTRYLVGALAAAAVLIAVAILVTRHGRHADRENARAMTSTVPECPVDITATTSRPAAGRNNTPLVPAGAGIALLCKYQGHGTTLPLIGSRARSTDIAAVEDLLNGLPGRTPEGATGDVCLLADASEYRIVLGYPNGSAVLVEVAPNCGTVRREGVVRYPRSLSPLLGLWPE